MKNELNIILKTKEENIDINTLEIVLDDKERLSVSLMNGPMKLACK